MSLKTARSRSTDSLQERLRERKDSWNRACTDFIRQVGLFRTKLVAYKRGLNGRGDQRAGLPISDIKSPLPSEIPAYMNGLMSEFEQLTATFSALASESAAITQEQTDYSNNRRQPVQRHSIATVKEASSGLSRFWANVSSIFSSDKFKADRLSLLSNSANLFEKLVELEDQALEKGIDNVPTLIQQYLSVVNAAQVIHNSLGALIDKMAIKKEPEVTLPTSLSDSISDDEREIIESKIKSKINKKRENIVQDVKEELQEQPTPEASVVVQTPPEEPDLNINDILSIKEYISYLIKSKKIDGSSPALKHLLYLIYKYTQEKDNNKKMHQKDIIIDSFKKIWKVREASTQNYDIVKNSSNFITRNIKHYMHRFGIKQPSTAARLEIIAQLKELKKILDNDVMDKLESSNIDFKELKLKIDTLYFMIRKIKEPVRVLELLYSDRYYKEDNSPKDNRLTDKSIWKKVRRDIERY